MLAVAAYCCVDMHSSLKTCTHTYMVVVSERMHSYVYTGLYV